MQPVGTLPNPTGPSPIEQKLQRLPLLMRSLVRMQGPPMQSPLRLPPNFP
jgi:hypothetical protein